MKRAVLKPRLLETPTASSAKALPPFRPKARLSRASEVSGQNKITIPHGKLAAHKTPAAVVLAAAGALGFDSKGQDGLAGYCFRLST